MARTNSQLITNAYTSPRVLSEGPEGSGNLRSKLARFLVDVSEDGAGHLYSLFELNAHDHLLDLRIMHQAVTAADVCNVGIWTPSNSLTVDPVVIDADCLVDGADLTSARTTLTSVLGTGTVPEATAWILDYGKPLWQYAQVATEPIVNTKYEIVLQSEKDPTTTDAWVIVQAIYVPRGN